MIAPALQSAGKGPVRCPDAHQPVSVRAEVRYIKRIEALFASEFGIAVYLTCGTLLGAMHDRALAGSGGDLDLAYISRGETEAEIAEEHRRLVRALSREGMLIGMHSTGHMHVAARRGGAGEKSEACAVDLWASWVREGRFYHYPDVQGRIAAESILPLQHRLLEGEAFWVPRQADLLLEALYGPSWRVPDSNHLWGGRPCPAPGKAQLPECPRRAEGVEVEPLANAFLVLHPGREDVRRVNATAALILGLCDGKTPVRELVASVQRAYRLLSAPTVAVVDFLIRAVDEGLIC